MKSASFSSCPVRIGFVLALCAASAAASADVAYLVMPHVGVEIYEGPVQKAEPGSVKALVTPLNTFNISYLDPPGAGFNDTVLGQVRQERLEEVLAYISRVLQQPGTLDIDVNVSQNDGTGALASTGTFFGGQQQFQNGSAFDRLMTGTKPFADLAEIVVQVDFGYRWNFGVDPPADDEFGYISVLLHEFTHGFGLTTLANANGASVAAPGVYTVWDSFLIRNTGTKTLFGGDPPGFLGSTADLISNDVTFNGPTAWANYSQAQRPRVYAPNPFLNGSSLGHWDQNNFIGRGVMQPSYPPGSLLRAYQPVDIGALIDLGYENAAQPTTGFALEVSVLGQGSVARNPQQTSYGPGAIVTLIATPANSDWTFDEWIGPVASTANATTSILMDWDKAVTARFRPKQGPQLSINPDPGAGAVDFGQVNVGASGDVVFNLTNTGEQTLNGEAQLAAGPFAVVGSANYSLTPNGSTAITVRFTPAQNGAVNATISFTGSTSGVIQFTLQGTGTGAGGNESPQCPLAGGLTGTPRPPSKGDLGLLLSIPLALLLFAAARQRQRAA